MSDNLRIDGRAADQLRRVRMTRNYLSHPLSSVLIEFGGTKVICAVSLDPKVPGWMKSQKVPGGWLTCEYGMLPSATGERFGREATAGKQGGRTVEIQRLIGRSLRSVIDLEAFGANTLYIDCDVIDADGGTRCASITGASVALALAMRSGPMRRLAGENKPMRELVAAVSVGIVGGQMMLDLNYPEDSQAEVDMNVVMTESGNLVEVQGTAERRDFSRRQLNEMLDLAESGLKTIFELQRKAIYGPAETKETDPKRRNPAPAQLNNLGDALRELNI